MYKELISSVSADCDWVRFQPPAAEAEIAEAQRVIGHPFPEELKALLRETNGDSWFLMSTEQMMERVQLNREIFLPLFREDFSEDAYADRVDRFVFFATNGCGDYYAYRVTPEGETLPSPICLWEHENLGDDCCWQPVADSLTDCIVRYYQNEI